MADEFRQTSRQLTNITLAIFALVGFAASIVTVAGYFEPDDSSSLRVKISAHKFQTPLYSGGALQSDLPAREMAKGMRSTACSGINQDEILSLDPKEIEADERFKSNLDRVKDCKLFIDLEFAARWNGEYSDDFSTMYEYEIVNDGNAVATGIKLRDDDLNSAQYKKGDKFINIPEEEDGGQFKLPDLSPRETMTVLAWNNNFFPDLQYYDAEYLPQITFSGSDVSTELYRPVSGMWYDLYDWFKGSPVMLAIFVIIGSIFVVVGLILIISIIEALATGKPISGIFKSSDATKSAAKPDADVTA